MTTTRRFTQAPPDKAEDLFEKLLATSDNALKSRERLLADLKGELELLATLQEEHLFPVLIRHGMQDLVRDATDDNRQTAALLAELETMPKNGSEFIGKVSELRRAFQQHIRDDRKELLPAVLKVLSDEEASAVVEQVEDEMASIEEAKRADMRRTRDEAEAQQGASGNVPAPLRASVDGAQTIAQAMQEAIANSFSAFSELARHSTGRVMQAASPETGSTPDIAGGGLLPMAQPGAALARGLQDVSREMFDRSQKRLQRNLDGLQALARCRSMTDLMEVQSTLLRDNLEQSVENSRRLAELTMQMTEEAAKTVTAQAGKTAQRFTRAA